MNVLDMLPGAGREAMPTDADGRRFFGFCGTKVYVPDEDPRAEGIADGVLRRFRERLQETQKVPAKP